MKATFNLFGKGQSKVSSSCMKDQARWISSTRISFHNPDLLFRQPEPVDHRVNQLVGLQDSLPQRCKLAHRADLSPQRFALAPAGPDRWPAFSDSSSAPPESPHNRARSSSAAWSSASGPPPWHPRSPPASPESL